MIRAIVAAVLLTTLGAQAQAGVIERACNGSDRAAANRQLCNCIQQVADISLDRRDQRRAAKFFKDPASAQVVRQSDRASDESFWKRYRAFGKNAEGYCRRS